MSLPHPFDDDVPAIVSTAELPNPPMTFDEEREELAAAHQLIRAKYDAGIPFFTKTLFRDVVRQIESDEERIFLTGLDGLSVHFPIETGSVYRSHPYGDDFACFVYGRRALLPFLAAIPTYFKFPLSLFVSDSYQHEAATHVSHRTRSSRSRGRPMLLSVPCISSRRGHPRNRSTQQKYATHTPTRSWIFGRLRTMSP